MFKINKLLNTDTQLTNDNESTKLPTHLIAIINETNCIGCNRCSKVCPVNAIVGSARTIHTVVAVFCTGCSLCIASCPTQCISLQLTKVNVNIQK